MHLWSNKYSGIGFKTTAIKETYGNVVERGKSNPLFFNIFYLYKHGTAKGGWTTVSNHLAVRLRSFNHSKAPIVFGTATPVSYDFWAIGVASRFVKSWQKEIPPAL